MRSQHKSDFLQLALEAGKIGTFEVDLELARHGAPAIRWNAIHEEIFGLQPGTFDGRKETFHSLLHHDDVAPFVACVKEAIAKRQRYQITVRVQHPSGAQRFVTGYGKAVYDSLGRATHILGVCQDTTDNQRLLALLRQEKERAERDAAKKGTFLARMSHEFRTPLSSIIGFVDVLKQHIKGIDAHEGFQIVERNAQHLLRLANDILDLSRSEAAGAELHLETCECKELIEDALSCVKGLVSKKGLALEIDVKVAARSYIVTDRGKFKQVMLNLLSNALKYTEVGSVKVRVERDDGLLSIYIVDTGIGIKETCEVFEPFYREQRARVMRQDGVGLGLALSKSLAITLGGGLELVQSMVGVGSTFRFYVPVQVGMQRPPTRVQELRGLGLQKREAELPGIRVLVAEDCRDLRLLMHYHLQGTGADVRSAKDGEEAVKEALHDPPDIIIMDLEMPVLDGFGAAAKLRSEGFAAPIIGLTAHGISQVKRHEQARHFDKCFTKPLGKQTLVQLIREAVTERRQSRNVH